VGGDVAVRAVVCDLGGVVIRIDADRIRAGWARLSALPVEAVYAAYPDDTYDRFERDEVTEDEYLWDVRSRLHLDGTDEEIRAAFNDLYLGVNHGTLALLRRLREHGALVLALTNTNRTHHRVWSRRFADALEVFDEVHSSHVLGCRKPEPEVFRRVLDEHDLTPEEVVFIDDMPGHVAAAQAVGMEGIIFTDAQTLADQLATFDWPGAAFS
jgi:glucose-1-phosphatase